MTLPTKSEEAQGMRKHGLKVALAGLVVSAAFVVFRVVAPSNPRLVRQTGTSDPTIQQTSEPSEYAGRNLIYPEVQTVAKIIGSDTKQLLGFVASDIGYDSYVGALRGPRGVLLSGAGNDVDKSLLLRELIRQTDPKAETRFA